MRLSQLRYFLAVCQYLNITKVAKMLHISQPSLSVAIKELEQELGVNLFQRSNQRIHLTKEGNFFYEELAPLIKQLDQLTEVVKDMGQKKNLVRIGIPPMMGSFLFPQIFKKFKLANPEIKLEITEYGALEVQQYLLNESLDLILSIRESILNDSIQFKPLINCRMMLCVNHRHRLAGRESITVRELAGEPLILFNKGFFVTKAILDAFAGYQLEPNIILETSQINTIRRFIQEDLAVSILIEDCIAGQDDCRLIPIEEFGDITIGLGWKQGRLMTSDTVTMIEFMDTIFPA